MARSADAVHAVIKAYDVRGLLGEQIDESFVFDVGSSFARLIKAERDDSAESSRRCGSW